MTAAQHRPARNRFRLRSFSFVFPLLFAISAVFADESLPRIPAEGIPGALVLIGGGSTPAAALERFLQLAGGKNAKLVVIPSANETFVLESDRDALIDVWKGRGFDNIEILHTREKETADTPQFVVPLKTATAVWIGGGRQTILAATYSATLVEKELHAVLGRGGVIGGTSAGAAIQSRVMLVRGEVYTLPGFGLLPDAIIDQHFLARNRRDRLLAALDKNRGLVGYGIDEGTALVIKGRDVSVIGESTVTVCLAASAARPAREVELKEGDPADFTAFRRAAIARTQEPFPPEKVPEPNVPSGSLVIVGGGGMPKDVTERFIELAGGPDSLIVVLPTANPDPLPERLGDIALFERAGAKNVKPLRGRTPDVVESEEFLNTLKDARGVWFGGGRQWRFIDAYAGTKAEAAFRDVLRRGGVIGGSSAGATIQAYYLSRGSPLGNTEMMTEGYERGLAFLPGTAIDQHFAQRKRFPDMTLLMQAHPQLLGIGIDEATAIVVQGSTAEVVGKSATHFYDRRKAVVEGAPDYETVPTGGRYDLKLRKVLSLPAAESKP